MSLTIHLTADAETRLARLATAAGLSPADLAARLLNRAVAHPAADKALAEFRHQVAHSGNTDAQLDALFEELREDVWRESGDNRGGGDRGRRAA